jgi:hypothetical protein
MGQQDDDKRRPQTPPGAAGTEPPATGTAPPARSPVRGPRTLARKELESLRARLQKKFH